MSESSSKVASDTAPNSASLRRPTSSILAPSRLGFGVGLGSSSDKSGGSSNVFGSKVSFPGLKASKLSSVAEAVCTTLKADDGEKPVTSTTIEAPATPTKPSFIPLAKEETSTSSTNPTTPAANGSTPVTAFVASPKNGSKQINAVSDDGSTVTSSSQPEPQPSSQFVFGENLLDRAANYVELASKNGDNSSEEKEVNETKEETKSAGTATSTASDQEKAKSLSESAAKYCESRSKKVELGEVELITGEENEANVFQMSAKLYFFEKSNSSWVERGRGQLRLNDLKAPSDSADSVTTSRIIIRTAGSLRVILNSKIFPEMTVEKPSEKNIRLTALDGMDQGIKVFLISGLSKDIGTLFVALTRRLETLKKSVTFSANKSPPQKRKLTEDDSKEGEESKEKPPPEKEPKVK